MQRCNSDRRRRAFKGPVIEKEAGEGFRRCVTFSRPFSPCCRLHVRTWPQ